MSEGEVFLRHAIEIKILSDMLDQTNHWITCSGTFQKRENDIVDKRDNSIVLLKEFLEANIDIINPALALKLLDISTGFAQAQMDYEDLRNDKQEVYGQIFKKIAELSEQAKNYFKGKEEDDK